MKKLIAVLVAVCLFFAGALTYKLIADKAPAADKESAAEDILTVEGETAAQPQTMGYQLLDKEAIYSLYSPETVVATINGSDITWGEYFYWMVSNAAQVESYFASMASYGMENKWSDPWSTEGDDSYADYVLLTTVDCLKESHSVFSFAEENGIGLTQEDKAKMAEIMANDKLSYCGEDATEEDFEAFLAEIYMPRSLYDAMNSMNLLYQRGFTTLFGENGEKVTDEDGISYLEENGFIYANHILFMTIDPNTGAALDEAAVKAQLEKAEELVINLRAHEGDKKELVARFEELKAEYCEDSGKTAYPSGYTFTPGTMVAEFEDTCNALGEYEISDPVLTSYGYHVIIRLPLDPDSTVEFTSAGTPLTARSLFANAKYGELLQQQLEATEFSYAEGFTVPNLMDYLA